MGDIEKMLLCTIFSCLVVLGQSLPHNWRYSNPSYRHYGSKRWGYSPYRHYNGHRWGYTPYSYHHKMASKGVEKESRAVEPKPTTRVEWETYCNKQEDYVEGCFEFTVSLVYTANMTCQEQAAVDSGFWWPEQTLRKPVGICTKNVIGNTVIFECDPEKGVVNEHVYHDVLDGSECSGSQCTCESEIVYTLPIKNGCSEQFFGGMHMVWDDFCPAPKKPGCPETKPAPSTVSKAGLVCQGSVMRIPDSKSMPEECGPIFFSGNTDIFQVPDKCCTAEVGAKNWLPLDQFGSHDGIDGCYALDPFQNGEITAILVNGCYDDGTQFYGEKCGGSDFGEASELAYGDCGPAKGSCACNLYVESKTPGCFAIATPEADPQFAVFLKMDGCKKKPRNYFPNI